MTEGVALFLRRGGVRSETSRDVNRKPDDVSNGERQSTKYSVTYWSHSIAAVICIPAMLSPADVAPCIATDIYVTAPRRYILQRPDQVSLSI